MTTVEKLQTQVNRFSGTLGFRPIAINGVVDAPTAHAALTIAFWNLDRLKAPKTIADGLQLNTGGGPSGALAVPYVARRVDEFSTELKVLADSLKLSSSAGGSWLLYGLGAVVVLYFLGRK